MTYRFSRLRRQAEGWRRGLLLCSVVAGLAAPLAAMADTPPLRVAIAEDALTLDPIASSDNASIWAELLIYDQLVRPSVDGTKLEPDLADRHKFCTASVAWNLWRPDSSSYKPSSLNPG